MSKPLYLSGLNGIRAIAAVGVMLSHINLALGKFGVKNYSLFGFTNYTHKRWNLGEQGVTMFFVLSGFLITFLLIKEKQKTNHINIRKFYSRRILRIWPLYYFYLVLTLLCIIFLFQQSLPSFGIVSLYVFLLANIPFIVERALLACDHLWSIAVEEQFYLFWPHFFNKNNINRLYKLFVVLFFCSVILRILLWMFFPYKFITVLFTVNRFDCMIFGGIMAICFLYKPKITNLINKPIVQLFGWAVIGVHILNYEILNSIVSMELITLATGFIIISQVSDKNKIINLEKKALNFLGKHSYGIYVYHPLLIILLSKSGIFSLMNNEMSRLIFVFLSIVVSTILIAIISYELMEKKFIRIKSKYSIIHSTNENKT